MQVRPSAHLMAFERLIHSVCCATLGAEKRGCAYDGVFVACEGHGHLFTRGSLKCGGKLRMGHHTLFFRRAPMEVSQLRIKGHRHTIPVLFTPSAIPAAVQTNFENPKKCALHTHAAAPINRTPHIRLLIPLERERNQYFGITLTLNPTPLNVVGDRNQYFGSGRMRYPPVLLREVQRWTLVIAF